MSKDIPGDHVKDAAAGDTPEASTGISAEITPERWRQIKTILDASVVTSEEAGEGSSGGSGGGDPGLWEEAEKLRRHEREVEDFLEEPLWDLQARVRGQAKEGGGEEERIGPYRIERILGKGGMGTVYLASREDDYEQRVAIKIVNWELGREELLARFYTERQILARLQHPGIARLLDGGTTAKGMPYFVMEYVEGVRIDRYCEQEGLSIRRRLEIFRQVCAAVHFAHQNLIVHRDLKTGNILVTEEGEPRLLDFGIAKLLEPNLPGETVATLPGRGPMTPAYASPEQLQGQPITTASDIYALGVLLYRLLSGESPYSLEGKSYPEMVRLVCHREPLRPSQVRRNSPASDASDEIRLRGQVAEDLDAIVLKAMRKEAEHRYGSVAEMSEDIHNHFIGLPVQARQGTWSYYTGKFLRRNTLALAILLLILASAATTTVLWWQAVRQRSVADQQRTRAEREQVRSEEVTKFLVDLLRSARPDESRGGAMTVREAVDLGRDRILKNLSDEPEIRADIIGTLGSVYGSLGELAEGRVLKDKALALRQQGDATDRPELAADILGLAKAHYDLGEYEAAELQFRQALAMRRRLGVVDEDFVTFVFNLAAVLVQRGKSEEAESLHLEALELRKTLFGPEDRRVASSLIGLGALYRNRGDLARAEEHFRQALKIRVETLGEKNTRVARVYNSLGWTQHLRGEHGAAEDSFERALAIRQAILGKAHPETARTKKNLASLALDRGEIDRAEVLINEALVDLRRALPEGDWTLAEAESVLGGCLVARGRFAESEEYLLRSYRIIEAVRSSDSRSAQEALGRILELYAAWGKDEELARYQALAEGKTATFRIGGE